MEVKLTTRVLVVLIVFGAFVLSSENDTSTSSNSTDSNETSTSSTNNVETFSAMEKRLKASVGRIIKSILPALLRGSSDADVSGQCTASVMKVIGGLRQLREWAIRFLDATGKIPAGVLEGTTFAIGDYDECLDIVVGRKDEPPRTPDQISMTGQYCLVEFHGTDSMNRAIAEFQTNPDAPIAKTKTFLNTFVKYRHLANSTFKMGVCIPSKCSREDLANIANSDSIREHLGKISVLYCNEKGDEKMSTEQKALMYLFGLWTSCMIIGTVIDSLLRFRGEDSNVKPEKISAIRQLFKKTSLYNNATEVFNTNVASDPLACLRGLRVVIVGIIIYSHTYAHLHKLHFQKFAKAASFLRFFDSFTFAGIGNGTVTLDSLVFILALTVSFKRWRYVAKRDKAELNTVKFFLSRYIRLSAAQLLTICIFLLFPLLGSGPFWNAYVDPMLNNCRQRWWLNIIYISNFWKPTDLCIYHSWIFSLMIQLFIIGFIIFWILKRSLVLGILLMVLLTLGGVVGVAMVTVMNELPGALAFFMLTLKTFPIAWEDIFQMPFDHFGPFCMGLLVGYFLAVQKEELKISKITSVLLWCSSIACSCAVLFGLYSYRHGESMDFTLSIFYAVLHRNVWCLGIGWLVIACTTHHGGPISRVLKSNMFIPLDRLCLMTYLIHLPILYFHSGSLRNLLYMGHMDMLLLAISYIVVSFGVGFILYIIFVSPYFAIEEYICSFFKSKEKLSFQAKTDLKSVSIPNNMSTDLEATEQKKGCVNLAYSRKIEG